MLSKTQDAIKTKDMVVNLFGWCADAFNFIIDCFKDPGLFIDKVQVVAPDVVIATLAILILLRFLGFKDTTKWITLALVIACIIATL
ncbi:MAG: hypothetical protein ACRCXT_21855 [Paraclostridium sp.]